MSIISGDIIFLFGLLGMTFALTLFTEALVILSWGRYKKYRLKKLRHRRKKHFK